MSKVVEIDAAGSFVRVDRVIAAGVIKDAEQGPWSRRDMTPATRWRVHVVLLGAVVPAGYVAGAAMDSEDEAQGVLRAIREAVSAQPNVGDE